MQDDGLTLLLAQWSEAILRVSMHEFNHFARSSGMSLLQLTVMMDLYHRGPHEVTGFAEIMQISPAGASQMVERLVQQGMVTRVAATDDRRVREVHLTAKGRAMVDAELAAQRGWLAALAGRIPHAAYAPVCASLTQLLEALAKLEGEAKSEVDPAPAAQAAGAEIN